MLKSLLYWLNYTGFLGDVCVAFFNVSPGNKEAVTPNPPKKEESRRVYKCEANAYQSQLKAGFSEVCEKCKVCGIIFLNYIREFHTRVLLLWWHFHAQKRDAEQNELWLVVWHVGQTASWAGLGQWMQPYVPDLQQSVWSVSASTQNRHFFNYIIIYLWGILSWNFTDTFCPTWDLYYIL